MVILQTIETDGPGGAEQVMLRLADAYRQRGHRQIICLLKDGWLAEQVRVRGYELLLRPMGKPPDILWVRWFMQRIRELEVNAVHSHEFAMNFHAGVAARMAKIPAVATFHGRAYYADTLPRRAVCRVIGSVASVVAVSNDIRQHLRESAGVPFERIDVIPNGVDVEKFCFDPNERERQRRMLGISPNEVLVGAIGSYYPVKGHRYLVEAMAAVATMRPDVRLVIAGQGLLQAELENQITACSSLKDRARLLGYVENPASLLNAFDIFAMPSLSEGMPLALLEAAANGRPIVATDVGGIPELLKTEESGLLVPASDSASLANALLRLVGSADLRERLGAAATRTVREQWAFAETVDRYLRLLTPRTE